METAAKSPQRKKAKRKRKVRRRLNHQRGELPLLVDAR
jgi:hypothetical protein